jgi:hypothetical protein
MDSSTNIPLVAIKIKYQTMFSVKTTSILIGAVKIYYWNFVSSTTLKPEPRVSFLRTRG